MIRKLCASLVAAVVLAACSDSVPPPAPVEAEAEADTTQTARDPLVVNTFAWQRFPQPGATETGAAAVLNDKLVLFTHVGSTSETWEWDGATWTQKFPANSPSPRDYPAMARYGNKIVLVGGLGSTYFNDTWEWDGVNWTQRQPVSTPPISYGSSMVEFQGKLLFFGGFPAQTWEWNGTDWSQRTPTTSPSARNFTSLATLGNTVVMFGGENVGAETWIWDGTNWTLASPPLPRPPARGGHKLASTGSGVLLFGGYSTAISNYLSDSWLWDGGSWANVTGTPNPGPRGYFGMDSATGRVMLYGGAKMRADLWEWDGGWTRNSAASGISGSVIGGAALAGSSLVVLTSSPDGGTETYLWDGGTVAQVLTPTSPSSRNGSPLASRGNTSVVLACGFGKTGNLSDVWEFNGSSWTSLPSGPSARYGHGLASYGTGVLLHGGGTNSGNGGFGDTWELTDGGWVLRAGSSALGARSSFTMGSYGNKVVALGGYIYQPNGTNITNSYTFEYASGSWAGKSASRLPPPGWYEPTTAVGNVMIMGDTGGTDTIWEWSGSNWTDRGGFSADAGLSALAMGTVNGRPVIVATSNTIFTGTQQLVANGGACNDQFDCASGVCVDSVCCATACNGTCQTCSAAFGAPANGVCGPATGSSCSDSNKCTTGDTCQAGSCVGAPVDCSDGGQCRGSGSCNAATGACVYPAFDAGTPCNDGNLCTQQDVCSNGTCVAGTPVTCTASDQCHDPGTCSPTTGACSNPSVPDFTACNDGNACTTSEVCLSGLCQGGAPVICSPSGECRAAATCGPNGSCSQGAPLADGTPCSIGQCQSGSCVTVPDAGSSLDAGVMDAGTADAGSVDAGTLDAGSTDAGSPDAGTVDAGSADAGDDAGVTDAGNTVDGGQEELVDAGNEPVVDAGETSSGSSPDAGTDAEIKGGCGCGATSGMNGALLFFAIAFAFQRRRRA